MKLSRTDKITLLVIGLSLSAVVLVVFGVLACSIFQPAKPVITPTAPPTATPKTDLIETLSSTAYLSESGDCVTVEGEVKNISTGSDLAFVEVVVTYRDINHNFLSSDTGYLEYQLLEPGQTSPFKVFSCFPRADEFEFYVIGYQSAIAPLD